MERLNKIFAEWAKDDKKTELASEKVELGLIDDLNKETSKIEKAKKEITNEANKISKLIFDFRDVVNNYKTAKYINLLDKYTKAAKDLGLKIDNKYQQALDQYQEEKGKQSNKYLRR